MLTFWSAEGQSKRNSAVYHMHQIELPAAREHFHLLQGQALLKLKT